MEQQKDLVSIIAEFDPELVKMAPPDRRKISFKKQKHKKKNRKNENRKNENRKNENTKKRL